MPKMKKKFVCSSCGTETASWSGKCQTCGEWNTLEEEIIVVDNQKASGKPIGQILMTSTLSDTKKLEKPRIDINWKEVNRLFGGGIVQGSVSLLAGEPGIGKSTILMQICKQVADQNKKVLYVSGEESAHQVAERARRLEVNSANISLANSSNTDNIVESINTQDYDLVIVDSIQTVYTSKLSTSPGSVSQISSSANLLLSATKVTDTTLIMVGHVTKEGSIAGPKILEHIVDAVFQLEGDRYGGFRILRSVKNRFGATNETVMFDMDEKGLKIIDNPSAALLAERRVVDGSVVFSTIEGSRPLLVEVQALVNKSNFGYPKRTASGIDLNRLNLLVAVIEKRTKLNLYDKDIFINIVGGIKVSEPAIDLAVCVAIASATKGLKPNKEAVIFGEVGLSGEVRNVPFFDRRVEEAKKLGFKNIVCPNTSLSSKGSKDLNFFGSTDIKTTLNKLLT